MVRARRLGQDLALLHIADQGGLAALLLLKRVHGFRQFAVEIPEGVRDRHRGRSSHFGIESTALDPASMNRHS
jgi:hypothetical protein